MPSEADRALFLEATRDVIPLKREPKADTGMPPPAPRRAASMEAPVPDGLSDHPAFEGAEFCRPGLSRELRKLRQGRFRPEGEIDLHGMTSEQARGTLAAFVTSASRSGIRVVRIIHGKGYGSGGEPVLRGRVRNWLAQIPAILAFCEAKPREGGSGALIALIKIKPGE